MTANWRTRARCLGAEPDIFFPEAGHAAEPAKAICADCPVTDQCLRYAMANDERFGVWGGLSERQRHHLRQVRHLRQLIAPDRRKSA